MQALAESLKEAEAFHGHRCGGLVLGVRMALLGLAAIGIADPKGADRKKLIVFVEIDRCATDAITVLTGCRPGRRSMKIKDFGKMAATFVNLETGLAVRVSARTRQRTPEEEAGPEAGARRLLELPDSELFRIQHGRVELGPGELPGFPVRAVPCAICGETVMDMRDLERDGRILCQPCAQGSSYFSESLP